MRVVAIMLLTICSLFASMPAFAAEITDQNNDASVRAPYITPLIDVEKSVEVNKSVIFDASKSFIPENITEEISYIWDFGDGNINEGVEVLHAYQQPGSYNVNLKIKIGERVIESSEEIFVHTKLLTLITDKKQVLDRITSFQEYAKSPGRWVDIQLIESFGSSTAFISEEVLTKKITTNAQTIKESTDIVVWTNENAGLNALSRYLKSDDIGLKETLPQKNILVIENSPSSLLSRIERQFDLINPKNIFIAQEGTLSFFIDSDTATDYMSKLNELGYNYENVSYDSQTFKIWNFMGYFVDSLIEDGVPDNTIALLLLLPVIATVIAICRQVIGITTMGIYTPSIITLSFLIIGIYAGVFTLIAAITIGALSRPMLKKIRMLFIPKMAIVISLVALVLFILISLLVNLGLFDVTFISIAVFPMLILSTLVEKFFTAKSDRSVWSAFIIMSETVLVSLIAYVIVGGEIPLGVTTIKFEFVKNLMLNYPEIIILLLILNLFLGKWTGLRFLERIRFRDVLRHSEE
jgi:hypothetical protein